METILYCKITNLGHEVEFEGPREVVDNCGIYYIIYCNNQVNDVHVMRIACLENMAIDRFIIIRYGSKSLAYVISKFDRITSCALYITNETYEGMSGLVDTLKFIKTHRVIGNNIWQLIPDYGDSCVRNWLLPQNIKSANSIYKIIE
jgi:hypothetical protein